MAYRPRLGSRGPSGNGPFGSRPEPHHLDDGSGHQSVQVAEVREAAGPSFTGVLPKRLRAKASAEGPSG